MADMYASGELFVTPAARALAIDDRPAPAGAAASPSRWSSWSTRSRSAGCPATCRRQYGFHWDPLRGGRAARRRRVRQAPRRLAGRAGIELRLPVRSRRTTGPLPTLTSAPCLVMAPICGTVYQTTWSAMTSSERTTFRPLQRYEQIAERLADDIRSGRAGARRAAAVGARPRAHARGQPRVGARGAGVAAAAGRGRDAPRRRARSSSARRRRRAAARRVARRPCSRPASQLEPAVARLAAARAPARRARPRSCSPRWRPSRWTSPPGTPPTASSTASSRP